MFTLYMDYTTVLIVVTNEKNVAEAVLIKSN